MAAAMSNVYSHELAEYRSRWNRGGDNRWNGAYYYSIEIVRNIIPRVKTSRPWVTINQRGACEDGAIVFVHNNKHPEHYEWLRAYRDLVLVCGVPETMRKVEHLGTAVHLPLSIDVAEVMRYRRPKTLGTCAAGRPSKVRGIAGVDILTGMPREQLLAEMAKHRKVYAVGRTAIEARALGCEVLATLPNGRPFDARYPDPGAWQVLDNRDAAGMLQGILDAIDGSRAW